MVAVTADLLREWRLPDPGPDGDKHTRGNLVVLGGTAATPGAVLLAGLAGLRAGAGRLQLMTVDAVSAQLGVAVPEAMVTSLATDESGAVAAEGELLAGSHVREADAAVIGPGMSGATCGALVRHVLTSLDSTPAVVDAGALVALATFDPTSDFLGGPLVLTPNAGEAAALLGVETVVENEEVAATIAATFGAVVSVKGWIAHPDGTTWQISAGNPGLGTSGSGDVLAGLVGGLLARGASAAQAAVWGQYLHATAGDRLAARVGRLSFLARELLDEAPAVLRDINGEDS